MSESRRQAAGAAVAEMKLIDSPDGATWLKTLEMKLRHVRKE